MISPFGTLNFFDRSFQAFFKLTAEAGTGDHGAQIEGDHALAHQDFGNIVGGNLLRQSFDDGGFTNTGFADQDRVVLGAAAKGSA